MTHVKVGVTPDVHRWRCFLDGVNVSNDAFEADDEEGWVKRFARDEDGHYIIEQPEATSVWVDPPPAEIKRETVHGEVRLEFVTIVRPGARI